MARGAPDYSNVKSEQAIYTLLDLGELAARLGSIDVFDRSGNIVCMDDFEAATLNWRSGTDGTGASIAISTAVRLFGSQSCLLTTGSDATMTADIWRYLPIPNVGKYSFELAFAPDFDISALIWSIQHLEDGAQYRYDVKYDKTAKTLSYFNSAGGYTVFATNVNIWTPGYIFHIGKLTVDLTTGQYGRFRFNKDTYDLTGISAYPSASITADLFSVLFEAVGKVTKNGKCYADNALVKQNEP